VQDFEEVSKFDTDAIVNTFVAACPDLLIILALALASFRFLQRYARRLP